MIEKITQSEIDKKSVASLPTRPNDRSAYGSGGLSAPELRARFDALALLAISKYNELVGAIGKEGADGLISMMPSGIEGKSLAELLSDIRSGDLAGYLTAYSGEGDLQNLQTIITDVYEKLANAGAKLDRIDYTGKDGNGGNIYEMIFTDGASATFTAPKGEDGDDGLTPYIKNGTWWIGDTNTGTPASGGSGGSDSSGSSVKMVYGSYVGNGDDDMTSGYHTQIYLGFRPLFIVVQMKTAEPDETLIGTLDYEHTFLELVAVRGLYSRLNTFLAYNEENSYNRCFVEWDEDGVRLWGDRASVQFNITGREYIYFAIGE
jgi:hypothetical protein